MHGLLLKTLLALLLLVGIGHAGLVHRSERKETLTPSTVLDKDNKIALLPSNIDQIPVTIIHEPVQEFKLTAAAPQPEPTLIKESLEPSTLQQMTISAIELSDNDAKKVEQVVANDGIPVVITERIELVSPTGVSESLNIAQQQSELQAQQLTESSPQLQLNEEQSTAIITETAASLDVANSLKALASPGNIVSEQQPTPEIADTEIASPEISVSLQDDLQRQVTQATPTLTSTPQNFVQQLIQNSPIAQFLSQLTGQQQQQQQQQQPLGQVQADAPATPAPTLPGFLNPSAAITSAQQVVQNAAQSVVNTTTQAFQGLQQFATNLGTQFQNTFSTLAGQQSQLSTADSTTTRPPGPIQSIVSNFINPGNTAATTAAPGQQQQGPLQGILNFFQGGNRPQQAANANADTTPAAPPKEELITPSEVNDKIETEQQDAIVPDQHEPDAANEVRNSGEVTNEDTSFEEGQGEDLIVVNDDATQQDLIV